MSLESEIRKIMAQSVSQNFVSNPDCDICGDGSPCTCGESQEVQEATLNEMDPTKHVMKNKDTGKFCVYDANNKKVAEFDTEDEADAYAKKNHDDLMKKEDIRTLPRDKQRALQHADKTAKPKSKVSLAPTPGIKTEATLKVKDFTGKAPKIQGVTVKKGPSSPFGGHMVTMTGPEDKLIAYAKKHLDGKGNTLKDVQKSINEDVNLDEAFENFFAEGYEGEVKKVLDKKGIDAYFKNGKLMVSKRDKPMVMQILKRQDFDMPTIQVEEIRMENNRFGLSDSLVDAVANVLAGKQPIEEKKHKKMDAVGKEDGDIDNDGDEDESDEYLAKRRKAIGKAMKGEKNGGKEPVDTKPKMDEAKLRELDKSTLQRYVMKKKADIKRKVANTVDGERGKRNKDNYSSSGLADKSPGEKHKIDKQRVKLAKAKIAYKDANRDLKGPSSAGKKMAGESVVEYATNYMDERLKLGDPKRDSRELARTGRRVAPSKMGSAGTTKDDAKSQRKDYSIAVGGGQSSAQRQGVPKRQYKGAPEKGKHSFEGPPNRYDRMSRKDPTGTGNLSKDKLAKVRDKKDTRGAKGKLPEDMTDAQMKRREEIVKELKKKSADFESRYGDKADAVMYATATKMAMKGK